MKHLDEGVLRRWVDEPQHIPLAEREHYADCADCQQRYAEIAATARMAARLLQGQGLALRSSQVNTHLALARVRQRLAAEQAAQPSVWYERIWESMSNPMTQSRNHLLKPLAGAAAVAVLAGALVFTPLGSYAQGVLNLFVPQQFAAVPVSDSSIRTLPNLSDYGTMSETQHGTSKKVNSATEAAAAAGIPVLSPSKVPAGVPSVAQYSVTSGSSGTFTFSAAKAQAAAAAKGKTLSAMPANMDGSSLNVKANPVVVATYGSEQMAIPDGLRQGVQEARGKTEAGSKTNDSAKAGTQGIPNTANVPQLMVVQSQAPQVTSSGVTVPQLEQYLLSQPGIDPTLAAAIRGIADPSNTLPIPIPADKANSHPVQVQGVNGLAIGDSTGLGSAVIWQKGGVIYAVAGPLKESEVLDVANSLR